MTDKTLFKTPWVAIKETPLGFHYLERKGRDSVAIFLLRGVGGFGVRETEFDYIEILVRHQPLCINNATSEKEMTLYPCPITGGIEPEETAEACVYREVFEETGYKLPPNSVHDLGSYISGTQSNEVVHMF